MVKGQGKSKLIATIVVLAVTLITIGVIALLQNNTRQASTDTETKVETTKDDSTPTESTPAEPEKSVNTPAAPDVDPSTLSTIDIEPLGVAVSYTKGIPGFEFGVKRSSDGSQYVEFSAPELVGSKCTNDAGSFVSIIKDIKSSEDASTISQKVTVGGTTYGLSLTGSDCTSNIELLKKYQTAFSNGFSRLKEL